MCSPTITRLLAAAVLLSVSPAAARADATERLIVSGTEPPVSSLSPDALQPATILGTSFIRNVIPPTGAYDDVIRLSPGVVSIQPNGPGLGENAALTIRGFSDGQYNVTFDGIPFADTDDFTHHVTAYFASQALARVSVDRGPGTAATIGDATFGGTISLVSIDPASQPGVSLSGTIASFNTDREGLRLDSGILPFAQEGRLVVEAEHARSDGFLTNTGSDRDTLFAKLVQTLTPELTLTVTANTEWLAQDVAAGATRAQIARFGANDGLSDDPAQQDDARFNSETYRTDFSFAALHWGNDGLSMDERAYSYGLTRHFGNGEDVHGETPNGTIWGAGDVPGQLARNDLRAWGNVLRLQRDWVPLTLRLGLWAEHQINNRGQQEVDLTDDDRPNPVLPVVAGLAGSGAIDRLQHDTLDTLQPYGEAEWRPLHGLAVVAGLRWVYSARDVSAPVMEGTRLPTYEHAASSTLLPSVALRQHVSTRWSVYAQAAAGALAPALQLLDTTTAAARVPPERTWNFQMGSTWQRPGLSLGADGYLIQFDNLTGTRTVGAETVAFDQGGATYKGFEAETTVGLGRGLSLYGNADLSRARDHDTGAPVPNAPDVNLTGGLLCRAGPWGGSVIDKWIGARYGDTDRAAGLEPFNQLDLSASWTLHGKRSLRLALQVQNLLDHHSIDALAGYTVTGGTPLWFTQAGRSLWLTATTSF